ncbi:MAG: chromosome segregation protein SMC [Lachnospiraceae bacterium]|nr:chromosome segregation protein SMC [Lachnospiraceae bacterium]
MYLKSIEIQGFKSFANKLVMEFHNGITGIVGPNGSGKSNIADAVRWVLGEQKTKQLRSTKMEDVIFAGTENRKPLGFAYVSMTFDNSDQALSSPFDEVIVSRRLFRSGESEYRTNGQTCRLRDIQELFYDTGIGKEGYSIIGQGQIDRILSGRPEERRELFDEAAGIVKYKRRRQMTAKKLESESESLARVEDILNELERQIRPLERQSETARAYLRLRDELKEKDANLYLMDMEQAECQKAEIEKNEAIVQADFDATSAELETIRGQYEQAEAEIEALSAKLEATRTSVNEATLEKEKLSGQEELLREQIRSILSNHEILAERLASLEQQKLAREQEIAAGEQELQRLAGLTEEDTGAEDALYKDIQAQEADLQARRAEQAEKQEALNTFSQEKNALSAQISRKDALREQFSRRTEEIGEASRKKEADLAAQRETLESLNREQEAIDRQIEADKKELEEKTRVRDSYDFLLRDVSAKAQQNEIDYHREKTKLDSLTNMTERYEGYGQSTRRVMEQKAKHPGIIGVVADIIKTKKKYETAIETALGGSIQNIVTDNAATAKEMIEFLKANRLGRATFLPLSEITVRGGRDAGPAKEAGVLGYASDLVTVDERYDVIAQYLLGRILVADTMDNAIALARKYHQTLRIVTLEGELLSPGGSMTGGSYRNNSNLLSRRREMSELKKKLEDIRKAAESYKKEMADAREKLQGAEDSLGDAQAKFQEHVLRQNTIHVNLLAEENKAADLEDTIAENEEEKKKIEESLEDLSGGLSALAGEIAEKEEAIAALSAQIGELSAAVTQREADLEAKKSSLEERRIHLSLHRQRKESEEQMLARNRSELEDTEAELARVKEQGDEAVAQIQEKEAEISGLQAGIAGAGERIAALTEELNACAAEKERTGAGHREFFAKREEISDRRAELDRELVRLKSQHEKLEEKIDTLTQNLWADYELTPHQVLPMRNPEYTQAAPLRKEIGSLKSKIRELGHVNVNAIDQYKEVSERYELYHTQHEDLVSAKKNLEGIIAELEDGMRRQFAEKMVDIRREFDLIFKELFGGGTGTIEIDTESDILETDISIIAQPPGKKLQNMMQLSGGEKALTAIALLFAFQSLKPSPFCLLDEIEAALDGSNVVRFSEYLHKLTEHTQFIVITHRRGTMAGCDRLYGITMQEKGVSALVSVNLIEGDLDK